MAKRKLTEARRVSLRRELKQDLSAGMPQTKIIRQLSQKYGIHPVSVRWYLRDSAIADAVHTLAHGRRRAGERYDASTVLHRVSEHGLKSLLRAKKLLPKLEATRQHEQELRDRIEKLNHALIVERERARKLELSIRKLSRL